MLTLQSHGSPVVPGDGSSQYSITNLGAVLILQGPSFQSGHDSLALLVIWYHKNILGVSINPNMQHWLTFKTSV